MPKISANNALIEASTLPGPLSGPTSSGGYDATQTIDVIRDVFAQRSAPLVGPHPKDKASRERTRQLLRRNM